MQQKLPRRDGFLVLRHRQDLKPRERSSLLSLSPSTHPVPLSRSEEPTHRTQDNAVVMTEEQHVQALRNRSTSEIIHIPARKDPKTEEYIVLWKDIQGEFEDAKSLWNGTSKVLFMTDEHLEE